MSSVQRLTSSVCPSGPRGYVQVVLCSHSWVRVPQQTIPFCWHGTVTDQGSWHGTVTHYRSVARQRMRTSGLTGTTRKLPDRIAADRVAPGRVAPDCVREHFADSDPSFLLPARRLKKTVCCGRALCCHNTSVP